LADLNTIAYYFRLGIRTLHLDQVKVDEMKKEVLTFAKKAYLEKTCFVRLAIFELQKLKAENMHLNRSKSLATGCYSQEE
jgi:hypothetical protein